MHFYCFSYMSFLAFSLYARLFRKFSLQWSNSLNQCATFQFISLIIDFKFIFFSFTLLAYFRNWMIYIFRTPSTTRNIFDLFANFFSRSTAFFFKWELRVSTPQSKLNCSLLTSGMNEKNSMVLGVDIYTEFIIGTHTSLTFRLPLW